MHDLRHYLSELCGVTLCCDFRFIGSAAPLPAKTSGNGTTSCAT